MKLLTARSCLRRSLALALSLGLMISGSLMPSDARAQQNSMLVRVVQNDRGGVVGNRAKEIAKIQARHQRVEIRGKVCLSSCTMYLGAGDVCVDPSTKFGFHGPSFYGKSLEPHQFEYWSAVIASYYPARLREWYMSEGRYKSDGYYTMYGAQLIRLGIAQC
ncbi:hypothetical protein [Thalassovita sp.]|uniref:hypothetical protein n=1 Tax=Thalassovita sp. TaxID=1979401 RepID=UPI003B5943D2